MQKIKITIGIPAFNEEENIGNILHSILKQKEISYRINKIVVVSDGSTDNTAAIVKAIKSKKINLIDSKKRIGKSQRMNDLFKLVNDEILILLDCDTLPANNMVIENLIQPIIKDKNVGLVGGNPIPLPGVTFIEKSINSSFAPYSELRNVYKGGNNVFGCDGRILALSKRFYKLVHVPKDMIANDAFMYFFCVTNNFKFAHAAKAKVWYRSPSTIEDHLKQNKRFLGARHRLKRIYGDVVVNEYSVPKSLLYKLLLKQFIKDPIHGTFIFLMNLYVAKIAKQQEEKMTAVWPMASTTKKGLKN